MGKKTADYRESAAYWFCILEIARDRDDFETGAQAKRELRRLGVNVTFSANREGITNA